MSGFINRDFSSKPNMLFNSEPSISNTLTFSSEAADPCADGVLYVRPHPVRGQYSDDMWQYSNNGSSWSNIGDKVEGGSKIGIVGSAEERAKSKAGSAGWALWTDAQSCITSAPVCSSNTSGGIVIFKSGNLFGMLNSSSKLLGWANSFNEAKLNVGGSNKCYIDRTSTSAISNVTFYDYDKFINDPAFYTTGEGSQGYTPPPPAADDDDDDDDDDDSDIETLTNGVAVVETTTSEIPMAVKLGIPVAIIAVVFVVMKKKVES